MAEKVLTPKEPKTPFRVWAPVVALGWLIPGAGHFIQKRPNRGALLLFSVAAMFFFGMMHSPGQTGSDRENRINFGAERCGSFIRQFLTHAAELG